MWMYWHEQLSVLIVGGDVEPRVALRLGWAGSDEDAARKIAEKLLHKLRERRTLKWAKPWSDVEGWFAWLVGAKAMRPARRRAGSFALSNRLPDPQGASGEAEPDPDPDDDPDERHAEILALVREWAKVLADVAAATGIAAIEWDWLWATCKARRLLATYLGRTGDEVMAETARWVETKRRALAKATSKPGAVVADRIIRTRTGAGACLRFNLESWASASAELAPAHRVFVGPADPRPPYQPVTSVDSAALDGFRHAVRLAVRALAAAPRVGVARVRAEVAHCAVRSAVLRLLPRQAELQLKQEWDELTSGGRS